MLTKIFLATALTIGAASAALASNENGDSVGGYWLLGPGGVVTDGVNPVYHPSLRAKGATSGASSYDYAPIGTVSKSKTK
jgi:hypothetical protein